MAVARPSGLCRTTPEDSELPIFTEVGAKQPNESVTLSRDACGVPWLDEPTIEGERPHAEACYEAPPLGECFVC